MRELVFTSLMASNADHLYRSIVAQLADTAGIAIRVSDAVPWEEREQQLLRGDVDIAAVCGAVYTRLHARPAPPKLLAAPVMRGARYGKRPVYFSDVVVRADATFWSFADLRGATWVFNEPASFSGYARVGAHLAEAGLGAQFFGQVRQSGSHQQSLAAVLSGEADAASIDSIVLERAIELAPNIAEQVRTVAVLGPNPVPPFVAAAHVAPEVVATLQRALLALHHGYLGRHVLEEANISHFLAVEDRDYDPIRFHLEASHSVSFAHALTV